MGGREELTGGGVIQRNLKVREGVPDLIQKAGRLLCRECNTLKARD